MADARKNVLIKLQELEKNQKLPINTADLSELMDLSRSVTSHYLNQLVDDGIVIKQDGRPVLWSLTNSKPQNQGTIKSFDNFIGANGSLKQVISQCEAAVHYPPNGLSMIITGDSGVGKSYLANRVYRYAVDSKVITPDAPFLVLNCADYANNPELLSSILFGYSRGAFTGANEQKDGLLKQANGGYLFLDEVHRLNSENQEKLFNFIDSGVFRRMGENEKVEHSQVRLLFATTEDTNEVLLETFRRRISISVHLPSYSDRPQNERLSLIYSIFHNEATRIGKTLKIDGRVINSLLNLKSDGNIGRLKNLIKVGCANAYKDQLNLDKIVLNDQYFAVEIDDESEMSDIIIDPRKKLNLSSNNILDIKGDKLTELINQIIIADTTQSKELHGTLVEQLYELDKVIKLQEMDAPIYSQFNYLYKRIVCGQYGLKQAEYLSEFLFKLFKADFELDEALIDKLKAKILSVYPRTYYVAKTFSSEVEQKISLNNDTASLLATVLLSDYVDESLTMHGLLVAHGEYTATSIQAVVNQLCGGYVFDAIDMPIDTGLPDIVIKTKKLLDSFDTTGGVVLLVDMGSLGQLYNAVKHHLDGDLLVIDNLTTATALDIGLKIQQKMPFKKIAETASTEYKINSRYFAGFSQDKNIIISCISGLGISQKIKETMQPYFPDKIKIITMDYTDLKSNIHQDNNHYFDQTIFVITTTDLPGSFNIPNINIYNILDSSGERQISKWLQPYLNQNSIDSLNKELLRFFSIEGVGERLSFLNPKVIIKEVETVIFKYENYYHLKLDGKVKLNLYMHIALMIERLMVRKNTNLPKVEPDDAELEFINVSKSIFQPLELKYNVEVNEYELSLMFEVFKQLL
ncbi:sigma 54-interacting transcriptional regulator [Companilactobacillus hulinensis]|uniref:sigma 54-interacting transcriptional regulator n=1 Tax=Companilactobacillus hulinensis TaxID=2486007 RepID=UPI000F77A603|nr:sigma 54-interacting transcriptional regulator [Companilactobacillus hulinensis]